MKHMKRFLAILLAVVMVLCTVPIVYGYSILEVDRGNTHWTLDRDTKTLTVTGSGAMPNGFPWKDWKTYVNFVEIGNGITTVGESCFSSLTNLTSVSLPSSLKEIQKGAFTSCLTMERIVLPESITYIGVNAFKNCELLSTINLPNGIICIDDSAFSFCKSLKTITLPTNLTELGNSAFSNCAALESITLPNGLSSLGDYTFAGCKKLKNIVIPNSIQIVGKYAFNGCNDLTGAVFSNAVTEIAYGTFQNCSNLTDFTVPKRVTAIEESAFRACSYLCEICIPKSVEKIGESAFLSCPRLTDVYYEGTEEEWNAITIEKENNALKNATIHFEADPSIWVPQESNPYNLGEETYSFENFDDGYCFGMAVTSSGYYLGNLSKTIIGGDDDSALYTFDDTPTVRAPIYHYFDIQGPGAEYQSIVAGGSIDLNDTTDTMGDWNACVDYVKDHSFDNKGSLNVGMWYDNDGGGHAVNFLYYAEVDGQERIYVYDNNFPEDETYYYLESDGLIYQAPLQTAEEGIVGLDLMDAESYFSLSEEFPLRRYIYTTRNAIIVEGATMYNMKCISPQGNRVMYELPDGATQVRITPQEAGVTFTYLDQTYTFGEIDEDTYGVLTLSATEDGSGTLVIENAPTHEPDQPDTPVTPEPDPEPENLCPWCGGVHEGFFAGLIAWFHSILARIFGARF